MSEFSYPPPIFDSATYNSTFYLSLDPTGYLTYAYSQTLYLDKNDYRLSYVSGVSAGIAQSGIALVPDTSLGISGLGALSCSSLTVNGSPVGSSPYITGITPGTAAGEKALVLDTSRNITNINSLTATTLIGTIGTAAQPNITSIGALSSLKVSSTLSQITLASSLADAYDASIIKSSGTDGQTASLAFLISANPTSLPTGSIVAVRTGLLGVGTMNFLNRGTTMLSYTDTTVSAKNLSLDLSSTGIDSPAYKLSSVAVPMGLLTAVVAGTGAASKVLSLNASRDVSNINNLTATKLTGAIQTASQPLITNIGTLGSLTISNSFAEALALVNTSGNTSASISYNNGSYYSSIGLRGSSDVLGQSNNLVLRSNGIDGFVLNPDGRIAMNGYGIDEAYSIKCGTINCDGLAIGDSVVNLSSLGATAGLATASKALVLDSLGSAVFGLGNCETNALRWWGSTSFKEIYSISRDSDDGGLVIGSRALSTQKASPILRLVSGYNVSGISGTSSSAWISHLVSDVYEFSFGSQGDLHRFAMFSGYALGAGDRIGGAVDGSSFICSDPVLNIAPGSSNTGAFTSSNNLLLGPNGCLINGSTFATAAAVKLAVNGGVSIGSNYTTGDSQLNLLDGTNGVKEVLFRLGNSLSSNNCMTIAWIPSANGSTANKLTIDPYGISNALTVTCARRVGIGTGSRLASLHVSINSSYTWNSGNNVGLSVYRLRTDSGVTETATGSATTYTNVAAIFNGNIGVEALVMQSDRRLKMDIEDAELDWVSSLYKDIKIKSYRWKAHPDKNKELGIIAQDLLELGYVDLIAQTPHDDPELLNSWDDTLEPIGVKLSVDYPKLSCYNLRMLQALIEQVQNLTKEIDELRATVAP